jgi:Protein of unknown function (DUF3455)
VHHQRLPVTFREFPVWKGSEVTFWNASSAMVKKQTIGRMPPEHEKGQVMKSSHSRIAATGCYSTVCLVTPALALLLGACASPSLAEPGNDNRAPDVPTTLQVPKGNKVHSHAYAVGVQIYVWTVNPTNAALSSWVFKAPEAVLFADAGENGATGIHYAGPTWECKSGSTVVGAVLQRSTPDPTAIPWLLLQAKTTEGPGIFERTTYIQRVNTRGGLAPAGPGSIAGQAAHVVYTAEYFFYRAAP